MCRECVMSGDVIAFPLKGSYDQALRKQSPVFQASKGYPAVRDPAAENPVGLLHGAGEGELRRLKLHYSALSPTEL